MPKVSKLHISLPGKIKRAPQGIARKGATPLGELR
jgi:hypothetical protein